MPLLQTSVVAVVLALLWGGSAFAQPALGDTLYVLKRSGLPNIVKVDAEDVHYAFDGGPLEIPFVLQETSAKVYWSIYTEGENPPGGFGGLNQAILRASGVDTMVYASSETVLRPGWHTLIWRGLDYHGRPVPPGRYSCYVFALNEIDDPTWVGMGPRSVWTSTRIDMREDPPVAWTIEREEEPFVTMSWIGTDFITNIDAFERLDASSVLPEENLFFSGLELDPVEEDVFYFANLLGQGGGVYKARLVGSGIFHKIEDWANQGHLYASARAYHLTVLHEAWHPSEKDDGMIYLGHMGQGDTPPSSEIIIIDRAVGEIKDIVDMSDIYTFVLVDALGREIQTVWAPTGHDSDENGLYVGGHGDAKVAHLDFEGNILWVNDNGDGFGDKLDAPNDFLVSEKYHTKVGEYGMVYISGGISQGVVFGPDGSGLFRVNMLKTPSVVSSDIFQIWGTERYDGLYYASRGAERFGDRLPGTILHMPYDIDRITLSVKGTSVEETRIEEGSPLAFKLGQNYPNPFNEQTRIPYQVVDTASPSNVAIRIYSGSGQVLRTLVCSVLRPGYYETEWDGTDEGGRKVGSGIYLCALEVYGGKDNPWVEMRKMALIR